MTVLDLRSSPHTEAPVVTPIGRIGDGPERRWTTVAWLTAICAALAAFSLRPGSNTNAFQDEGLYLFMGHRMIEHVMQGVHVTEYPGSYFSGAPGLYPVIGAMVESFAGLQGARILSLVFVMGCVVAIYSAGRDLFGRNAGLIGAGAFAINGSVVFVSHLATFDALAIMLLAIAFKLTTFSATRGMFLLAPVVGFVLAAMFFTKYGTAVFIPGVTALGAALCWHRLQWGAVRRALLGVAAAASSVFFVITFWAPDLMGGIMSTTASRTPISPASTERLLDHVITWAGPWLALAVLGAVVMWRRPVVALLLLAMSVATAVQHIRIHEETSLSKHLAFGLVFAAPLIGALGARFLATSRWIGVPFIALVAVSLGSMGLTHSQQFLTTWVDDGAVVEQLREDIPRVPGKAVLGEEPSAQRYELRGELAPILWTDTFSFGYDNLTGIEAYEQAIDQSHFGIIYLTLNTANGKLINSYLTSEETPYRLSAKVPFTRYDEFAGYYLVWTPKVLEGSPTN
ncbi:MAG: glycosyltransferase family 39 protein [Rhodococcus sp. (in: high G+C Gram-positive bacteria)]